jgi:hypothetical protein
MFVRGELLGVFEAHDAASRDVLIAAVLGGELRREKIALALSERRRPQSDA